MINVYKRIGIFKSLYTTQVTVSSSHIRNQLTPSEPSWLTSLRPHHAGPSFPFLSLVFSLHSQPHHHKCCFPPCLHLALVTFLQINFISHLCTSSLSLSSNLFLLYPPTFNSFPFVPLFPPSLHSHSFHFFFYLLLLPTSIIFPSPPSFPSPNVLQFLPPTHPH